MGPKPMEKIGKAPIVGGTARDYLDERRYTDYYDYKERLLRWLDTMGKNPERAEGYADSTVANVTYKIDLYNVWNWKETGNYGTRLTTDRADAHMMYLIMEGDRYSDTYKDIVQKCLKRVFKYQNHVEGADIEWEPEHTFSQDLSAPRDFLTMDERRAVRDAALDYGSVPAYNGLSPGERDQWRQYLSQRLEKPKKKVVPEDWTKANSWKIPSITWTSLDTGLRPIEVERARVQWVDTKNNVLRIPKDESSKNEDNWTVSITERTGSALERWLDEREYYDEYDDSDALWLTRHGNSYNSSSLRKVLHRLCGIAEIPVENRQMSWYTIRHSVGTYMTREEDLAAAKAQLRHKSPKTTMRYDQAPVEDRRDALNRMG
ncbi:xerC/D-like integrase [Halorubrum sp. AJ67]|nr:xerC/D-like integrase [Halorubrum sp. AJ67]